jgi:hypothetical protein
LPQPEETSMKISMRMAIGVVALALAIGVGVSAVAMYGSDDAPPHAPAAGLESAGDDTSTAGNGGGGIAASCLVGVPDCNDTPGMSHDSGGASSKCAANASDCAEPTICAPDRCSTSSQGSCSSGIGPDGSPFETCVGCGYAEPVPPPFVDPAMPVEPSTDFPLNTPADNPPTGAPSVGVPPMPDFDPKYAGTGCLGLDPCAVSARPLCVAGDCTVSSDGAVDCPYIPACNNPVPETNAKPVPIDGPCAVAPCLGNDPLAGVPESCPSDPCTIYSPNQPDGVPCRRPIPCSIRANGVPEPCPQPPVEPDGGAGGSTGSGGSSSGSAPPPPSPQRPE